MRWIRSIGGPATVGGQPLSAIAISAMAHCLTGEGTEFELLETLRNTASAMQVKSRYQ